MQKFVFSYSDDPKDVAIVNRFIAHSQLLVSQNKISLWHKKDLLGGDDRMTVIGQHFREANVIVLFSSVSYYNSEDFKNDKAWALNRHYDGGAKIIQVKILSTVSYLEDFTTIAHLPAKDSILSLASKENKDIDVICADVFADICVIAGLMQGQLPEEPDTLPVVNPKGIRLFLDDYFPGVHAFLTNKTSFFKDPGPELYQFKQYFAEVKRKLTDELFTKTYIHLSGTAMPSAPSPGWEENDLFNTSIQNEIRFIFGKSKGGDAENAQIAAKSRKNKLVKDVKKLLVKPGLPMILLGDPGTGKTMTIQQAVLNIIQQNEKRIFPLVPVYIRLGEFNTKVFELQVVDDFINRNTDPKLKPYLKSLLQANRRLVIFFDGMDEMSREGYNDKIKLLGSFADAHKNYCQCLFSCRINDFSTAFEYQRLVILPLGKLQIKKFLEAHKIELPVYINNEGLDLKKLVSKLSSGDLPMEADNPFILWLFCNFIQKVKRWPDSRVELMKSYVEEIYSIKAHDAATRFHEFPQEVETMFENWGQFAYILSEENAGTSVAVNSLFAKFSSNDTVFRMIAAGKICNLLRESRDGEEYLLKFEHQRFQEYFCAYYIYKSKTPIDWLTKLNSPRWQETLLNYLLLSQETATADLLIESIAKDFEQFKLVAYPKTVAADVKKEAPSIFLMIAKLFARKKPQKPSAWAERLEKMRQLQNSNVLPNPVPNGLQTLARKDLEPIFTDKIELGARLVKQLGAGSELKSRLIPLLTEAIYYVAENGNPISQGKMLLASQNIINDIDRHRITKSTTDSKISWIKSQAIILSTRNLTIKDNISNFILEVGLGIIRGDILKNFKTFYAAASNSEIPKIKKCIYSGLAIFLLKLVVLFVLSYGVIYLNAVVFARMHFFQYNQTTALFFVNYQLLYFTAALVVSVVAYKMYAEDLWLFIIGSSVVCIFLTHMVFTEIYGKTALAPLLSILLFCFFLGLILPYIALALRLVEHLYILLFIAINGSRKQEIDIVPALSAASKTTYDTKNKFGLAPLSREQSLIGILYGAGGAVIGLIISKINIFSAITSFIKAQATPIAKVMRLEYSVGFAIGLILLVISIPILVIVQIITIFHKRSEIRDSGFYIFTLFAFGYGVIAILFQYVMKFNHDYSNVLSLVMLVLLGIVALYGLYFFGKKAAKMWEIKRKIRKSKYLKNSFTEKQWKELLVNQDNFDQAEFIDKSEYFSIGFSSNKEFLDLLVDSEPLIKQENPALETYWTKRKKLEEEARQERK